MFLKFASNIDFSSGIPSLLKSITYFISDKTTIPIKELAEAALKNLKDTADINRFEILANGRLIQFKGPVIIWTGCSQPTQILIINSCLIIGTLVGIAYYELFSFYMQRRNNSSIDGEGAENPPLSFCEKLKLIFQENPIIIKIVATAVGIFAHYSLICIFMNFMPEHAVVEILPPGTQYNPSFFSTLSFS